MSPVCPKELVSFDPKNVTRLPSFGTNCVYTINVFFLFFFFCTSFQFHRNWLIISNQPGRAFDKVMVKI